MNKQTEALKMAIEFIEMHLTTNDRAFIERTATLEACKEALAQPAQEPVDVARVQEDGNVEWNPDLPDLPVGTKLYTHPAPSCSCKDKK